MHSAHGKAKSSPKACQRKSLVKSAYQSWIKHVTAVLKMSHSWLPTTLQGDIHTYIYTAFKLIFPEHISLLLVHWKKDFSPHAKHQTFHGYISHTHRLEALNVCCRLHSVYWKSASLKLKSPAERKKHQCIIHLCCLSYNRGRSQEHIACYYIEQTQRRNVPYRLRFNILCLV